VRELKERLAAISFVPTSDNDVFDDETVAFVESFQRSRGLPLTGVVDAVTYERLG
jgi:peptidoglycan hydrolase-like protein with peptidoglycan-binding domain